MLLRASDDLLRAARLFERHLIACKDCSREEYQVCATGLALLEQFRLVLINDALLDLYKGTVQ